MNQLKYDFLEHYKSLTTDELIEINRKKTLTESAQEALDEVLKFRDVKYEDELIELKKEEKAELLHNQRLASIGARAVAKLVDSFIFFLIFSLAFWSNSVPDLYVWTLTFALAYALFKDCFYKGQSLGKKFLGISVVNKTTGNYCRIHESFFRNLSLLLGIFDWIFILGVKKQRLGDVIANTIVINTKSIKAV